jgi:hypothetical protein
MNIASSFGNAKSKLHSTKVEKLRKYDAQTDSTTLI